MPNEVKKVLDLFMSQGHTTTVLTIREYHILADWFGIDYFDIH